MAVDLINIINLYDCIGWIPTIRGCLSLDLIDDAESILGDVDKYSVRFKKIYGLSAAHYLIASSLFTVNDTKAGPDFARTFRYIFTGSINDAQITKKFLEQSQLKDDDALKKYSEDEGLLIGHLTIVVEETTLLSDLEVTFLNKLRELAENKKEFLQNFNVDADSMEDAIATNILEGFRSDMLQRWMDLKNLSLKIETDEKNKRPTFSFDIVLTRDGILLLKDVSSVDNRNSYAAPNSSDDYTQNIPIHRLFKSAMNFVKYLFHSNYHHKEEHDTYLPCSNLHPAKTSSSLNLEKVFRHQLDAFLVPVIKMKRSNFASFTIEPKGIILYAKAFIRVFESHRLVRRSVTKKAKDFCDILEKEVEQMTSRNNTKVNAILTQANWFVTASGLLAFVFTCLKLITLFIEIPQIRELLGNYTNMNPSESYFNFGLIAFFAMIGYILLSISRSRILNKQFKPKKKKKNWFFRNSDINNARFSCGYRLYISYNTNKLMLGNRLFQAAMSIALFGCLVVFFFAFLFAVLG